MKTILKILGGLVGLIVVVVVGFVAFINLGHPPKVEPPSLELTVEATPERLARGKKLATLLCAGCHMDPYTGELTGRHMEDAPPEFGPMYSKNITRHPEKGIGQWTDGELVYLMRTGIGRDGVTIPPPMVRLPHMSDEDVLSVVAFLKSDDPMLAPVAKDPPGVSQPTFLTKFLTRVAFGPLPYPEEKITAPAETEEVAYGRYLAVAALDCYSCHSASFETMNVMEPEKTPGFFGGGNRLLDLQGRDILSANLTFDDTGIGKWSREEFVRAIRTGFRPDNTPILYPMLPMPELTEADAGAMYEYFESIPKIQNAVPRPDRPSPATEDEGEKHYISYRCYACHGENGVGIADLRKAYQKYPTDEELRKWIEEPSAIKPGTKMPTWRGVIKDDHYGPLMAYVRKLGEDARQGKTE